MLMDTYFCSLLCVNTAKQVNQQSCHIKMKSFDSADRSTQPFTAALTYGGRPATVQAILDPI